MSLIPQSIPEGAIRFNTDSSKMEVWVGDKWMQVAVSSPNLDGGARGLFGGGGYPNNQNIIDFITISSAGNATHFGDLIKERKTGGGGTSNSVRGVVGGGSIPATDDGVSFIEFITLASEGNGTEFGNLTANTKYASAVGSQTRAVFSGGSRNDAASNIIDFIEIATGGNAQDFGDVAGTTVFYNNGLSDCHGGLGGF